MVSMTFWLCCLYDSCKKVAKLGPCPKKLQKPQTLRLSRWYILSIIATSWKVAFQICRMPAHFRPKKMELPLFSNTSQRNCMIFIILIFHLIFQKYHGIHSKLRNNDNWLDVSDLDTLMPHNLFTVLCVYEIYIFHSGCSTLQIEGWNTFIVCIGDEVNWQMGHWHRMRRSWKAFSPQLCAYDQHRHSFNLR